MAAREENDAASKGGPGLSWKSADLSRHIQVLIKTETTNQRGDPDKVKDPSLDGLMQLTSWELKFV